MSTLKGQIAEYVSESPGLTDREITNAIKGPREPQQQVNQACRELEALGVVRRRNRDDGRIGNYPTGKKIEQRGLSLPEIHGTQDADRGGGALSEDKVKTALRSWLEDQG